MLQRAALVAALAAVFAGPVSAQDLWRPMPDGNAAWVRVLKPSFERTSALTSSWEIGYRTRVGNSTMIAALPFAHASRDSPFPDDESSTDIGNPYFGAEMGDPEGRAVGLVGFRLPLSGDSPATEIAGLADWTRDGLEAFAPKVLSFTGGVRANAPFGADSPFLATLQARGVWSTGGGSGAIFLVLGGDLWYRGERVQAGAGLGGRARVTQVDSPSRVAEDVRASLGLDLGRWRPGVEVLLPLDEGLRETAGPVFGIHLIAEL